MKMRTVTGMLALALVAATFVTWHRGKPSAPPQPAETRDGRWRQDIEYLAAELPKLHGNAFHTVAREDFERAVQETLDDVSSLSDEALRVRIGALVASIGDAHTTSRWWDDSAPALPFYARWFDDGFFVTDYAQGYEGLAGARITGLGSESPERVLEVIGNSISHENEGYLKRQAGFYMTRPEVLHAIGVVQRQDSLALTVGFAPQSEDSEHYTVPTGSFRRSEMTSARETTPYYASRSDEPYWFEVLDGPSKIVYFRYNNCRAPLGFWRMARRLKRALSDPDVEAFIVDLRSNGGGNSLQFDWLLLRGLRRMSEAPWKDRWFGLTDAGTFSSAMLHAVELSREDQVVLVGQGTGSTPNGYGEVGSFELPNSGIPVWYSKKYFELAPEVGDVGSYEPAVTIPLLSADYFAGRDPVLDYVVQLVRGGV